MEREFNLIDEPWICVRTADMSVKEVSLREAVINSHKYIGLAGEVKTQDFSILRLILAVIYTAFSRYDEDGNDIDEDYDLIENWKSVWQSGRIPEKPIERYFSEWYDRFWLFDEKYPFFQCNAVNGRGKVYSTSKMIGSLFESGNKPRLFADRFDSGRLLSYAESTRWLLHINNFDDIAGKNPTPKRPWTSRLSLIAVRGRNLFETLMLNYNAKYDEENKTETETKNIPSWENDNNSAEFNHLVKIPNNQAELLTLISRKLYLCRENGKVNGYYLSGGDYFEDDEVFAENMTMWKSVKDKKGNHERFRPKLYDASRKAWQEFGSMAVLSKENSESQKIPAIIEWVKWLRESDIISSDYMINIVTSAVMYNESQKTCLPVVDVVSDELTFHSQLLLDVGDEWREIINTEILKCEKTAVCVYYLYKDLQFASGRKDKDLKTVKSGEVESKRQFYEMIDRPFRMWLAELRTDYETEEYTEKLEIELKRTAQKFGRELASQIGDTSIFGHCKKDDKKQITSSAEALNIFESKVKKIFSRAGGEKNE